MRDAAFVVDCFEYARVADGSEDTASGGEETGIDDDAGLSAERQGALFEIILSPRLSKKSRDSAWCEWPLVLISIRR